jgi:hypothetical protein
MEDKKDTSESNPTPVLTQQLLSDHEVHQRLESLIAKGNDLYNQAAAIVANTQLVMGAGSSGTEYYDQENHFQAEIDNLSVNSIGTYALRDSYLTLATAEHFLYQAAVESLASCNEHDGELNLNVAHATLDEAQRELNGHINDTWKPPDITEQVNGKSECENGQSSQSDDQ